MVMKKLVAVVGALVAVGLFGLAFFPAESFEPPPRDLQDESSYELERKVGWFELEDGTSRLLTWGAERGLALYGFGRERDELRRSTFHPTSARSFSSPANSSNRLEFTLDDEGSVREAVLSTGAETISLQPTVGPYRTQEVRFGAGDVEISGLLFVPEGPGPHPAVAFIHGSGSSNRDQLWYLSPADALARRGIAVLLPDKRGSGKSGGVWHRTSFEEFATDAEGAVSYLADHPDVDGSRIGLAGFSQGGWIAPLAANRSSAVAFIVGVVVSAATPSEQVAYEVRREIINSGAPGPIAAAVAPLFARRAKMRRQEWWSKNGSYDPIEQWLQVEVPTLLILGEQDQNVDVPRSLDRLEASGLLDRDDFRVLVLPGLGHALIREDTGWLDEAYLQEMTDFIVEVSSGGNSP